MIGAVGIDVGGTWLRAARMDGHGRLSTPRRVPAPHGDPDALIAAIADLAASCAPQGPVGVGVAGLVDRDGHLVVSPNLAIQDVPLARRLAEAAGRPFVVANDASVAALAEQRLGAAADARDVVLCTVGTGVGGGVVLGGRLHLGRSGFAGEIGHIVVERGGRRCACGDQGCLEAYASATAIADEAARRLASGTRPVAGDPDGTDRAVLAPGATPRAEEVLAAAENGDELAQDVLREAGAWLGMAVAGLVNLLDPDVVVLGGGAGAAMADRLLPPAREALDAQVLGAPERAVPPFVRAFLGDDAGMLGAALLAGEPDRPGSTS